MIKEDTSMNNYNERVFNIMLEQSKSKSTTKDECNEECNSFQDTIGNGHNFSDKVVPNMKLTLDQIPVCKECSKKECNESADYFVDGRMLDIYMNDNGISDDAVAVNNLCEHYGIPVEDIHIVVECDEVNKGLIDHAKTYIDCGLLRRCHDQIRNCINAGIKVVKRS